jgi:hypothetical protein
MWESTPARTKIFATEHSEIFSLCSLCPRWLFTKEEMMIFNKYMLFSILAIGLVMLAVTSILSTTGLVARASVPSGRINSNAFLAAVSHLSSEIQISLPTSPECDRYKPAVAYNYRHDEYLVVWHNTWPSGHRDVYARRVSGSGQPRSWFTVSAGTNDRAQPAVAYNATTDEYLVAWMYNANGDGTTYNIWGRTIAWDGSYQEPETEIISYTNRTFWTPRVAWNSLRNEYLVVWNALDATTSQATDVAHAILDSDGNKLYGTIISSADMPHQADVAYNLAADEYLVVWRYMAGANGNIRGARVGAGSGVVVNPPGEFVISSASDDEQFPAVTTNEQDRYLVVWQKQVLGDWDIYGRELDVAGNLLGGDILIAIYSGIDERYPDVAARPGPGRDYLVVWQKSAASGEEVQAIRWGDMPGGNIEVAAAAFWNHEHPAVAWGKPGSLIVYEGDSQGDPTVYRHIYGRRWVPNAVFLPLVLRQ